MSKEKGLLSCLLLVSAILGVLYSVSPVDAITNSGWYIAELIETDNIDNAYDPQVAVDPTGNAVAVWYQHDGARYNIWSTRYTSEVGWGTAGIIETNNDGDAVYPQVAVDTYGNAVAVWYQFDGIRNSIWSNIYTAGVGWGTAGIIETDNAGNAIKPQVAVDPTGNAVAVWEQSDGIRNNIWSNIYTTGVGWGTAGLIETDNAGNAYEPQVAVDPTGNAVVVWYQHDGSRINILSNRYTAGVGWGTAGLIETDNDGDAVYPQVAVDPTGNAVAVWIQQSGLGYIWSNRYTNGVGWGTAEFIDSGSGGTPFKPQVAVDPTGNVVAVWEQHDGTRYNIWSNRYTDGIGWGTAGLIETDNAGSALKPQVAVDTSGNAVAVWHQNDGIHNNIWSNRYIKDMGWETAELIETDNSGNAVNPQVVIDTSGNAVAVWHQNDGTRNNIWSNHYFIPDTTPPTISLESPLDGLTIERPVVAVYGITESNTVLSINGMLVEVRSNGSFICNISLYDGANTIVVTATDTWNNFVMVSREVFYYDPLPSLLENLSSVLKTLISLETEMNIMKDDIDFLLNILSYQKYQLNKTYNNLDLVWENLSCLNYKLINNSDDLNSVWDNINYLQSDLNTTYDDMDSIRDTILYNQNELEIIGGSLYSLKDDLNKTKYDVFIMDYDQDNLNLDIDTMESDLDSVHDSQDSLRSDLERTRDNLDNIKLMNIFLIVVLGVIMCAILLALLFNLRRRTVNKDEDDYEEW